LLISPGVMGLDPAIPLTWDGNNYPGTGGGFRRVAWCQWPDPVFPAITREYRNDQNSFRFTTAVSGTIEALQLYTSTPDAKFGQNSPQLTISIQTDDGSGKPSGTVVASHTGTYGMDVVNLYSGTITAPMSASLTAGTVYHLVTKCDSLTAPSVVASGADYANSAYDFRLTIGGADSKVRIYDGTEDAQMDSLYYNQTAGGAYENQWVEGKAKSTDAYPDGHLDAEGRPLFETFATYDSQTGDVSNPIVALAEGYGSGYPTAGFSKGIPVNDALDAAGEKMIAHYPTAVPVAKKARIMLRWDLNQDPPDADVAIEVRDAGNNVLASGTYPKESVTNAYTWADVDLDTDVTMMDGQSYYVVATSPGITVGTYRIGTHLHEDELFPGKVNSYMGTEALMAVTADGGTTWTETDTRDVSFALAVVIPGDANGDHNVNVGDLGILAANYGQSPRDWATADFNGDTTVNVGDLGILAAHYGEHLPEPATMGLLMIGGLALLRRRRH